MRKKTKAGPGGRAPAGARWPWAVALICALGAAGCDDGAGPGAGQLDRDAGGAGGAGGGGAGGGDDASGGAGGGGTTDGAIDPDAGEGAPDGGPDAAADVGPDPDAGAPPPARMHALAALVPATVDALSGGTAVAVVMVDDDHPPRDNYTLRVDGLPTLVRRLAETEDGPCPDGAVCLWFDVQPSVPGQQHITVRLGDTEVGRLMGRSRDVLGPTRNTPFDVLPTEVHAPQRSCTFDFAGAAGLDVLVLDLVPTEAETEWRMPDGAAVAPALTTLEHLPLGREYVVTGTTELGEVLAGYPLTLGPGSGNRTLRDALVCAPRAGAPADGLDRRPAVFVGGHRMVARPLDGSDGPPEVVYALGFEEGRLTPPQPVMPVPHGMAVTQVAAFAPDGQAIEPLALAVIDDPEGGPEADRLVLLRPGPGGQTRTQNLNIDADLYAGTAVAGHRGRLLPFLTPAAVPGGLTGALHLAAPSVRSAPDGRPEWTVLVHTTSLRGLDRDQVLSPSHPFNFQGRCLPTHTPPPPGAPPGQPCTPAPGNDFQARLLDVDGDGTDDLLYGGRTDDGSFFVDLAIRRAAPDGTGGQLLQFSPPVNLLRAQVSLQRDLADAQLVPCSTPGIANEADTRCLRLGVRPTTGGRLEVELPLDPLALAPGAALGSVSTYNNLLGPECDAGACLLAGEGDLAPFPNQLRPETDSLPVAGTIFARRGPMGAELPFGRSNLQRRVDNWTFTGRALLAVETTVDPDGQPWALTTTTGNVSLGVPYTWLLRAVEPTPDEPAPPPVVEVAPPEQHLIPLQLGLRTRPAVRLGAGVSYTFCAGLPPDATDGVCLAQLTAPTADAAPDHATWWRQYAQNTEAGVRLMAIGPPQVPVALPLAVRADAELTAFTLIDPQTGATTVLVQGQDDLYRGTLDPEALELPLGLAPVGLAATAEARLGPDVRLVQVQLIALDDRQVAVARFERAEVAAAAELGERAGEEGAARPHRAPATLVWTVGADALAEVLDLTDGPEPDTYVVVEGAGTFDASGAPSLAGQAWRRADGAWAGRVTGHLAPASGAFIWTRGRDLAPDEPGAARCEGGGALCGETSHLRRIPPPTYGDVNGDGFSDVLHFSTDEARPAWYWAPSDGAGGFGPRQRALGRVTPGYRPTAGFGQGHAHVFPDLDRLEDRGIGQLEPAATRLMGAVR